MRYYLSLLIFTLALPVLTQAKQYIFTGKENMFYENPENWFPEYPGNVIHGNDIVIIQSALNFEGFDIIIEGKFMIELGETVSSGSGGLLIRYSGLLQNEGEIGVTFIENYGKINNGLQAVIFTDKYYSSRETDVKGMVSFSFQPRNPEGGVSTKSMVYLCPSGTKGLKPVNSNAGRQNSMNSTDSSLFKPDAASSVNLIRFSGFFSLGK